MNLGCGVTVNILHDLHAFRHVRKKSTRLCWVAFNSVLNPLQRLSQLDWIILAPNGCKRDVIY